MYSRVRVGRTLEYTSYQGVAYTKVRPTRVWRTLEYVLYPVWRTLEYATTYLLTIYITQNISLDLEKGAGTPYRRVPSEKALVSTVHIVCIVFVGVAAKLFVFRLQIIIIVTDKNKFLENED